MDLAGSTVLVTGGAIRIGRSIAFAMAERGATVVITFRSSAHEAQTAIAEIEADGGTAYAIRLDLEDAASIPAAVGEAVAAAGPIDVLVNNASYFEPTPFPTDVHAGWFRTFDVLVHGPYLLSNAVAPGMLERGRGSIINIVDLSAWHPWPDRGAHSVAKSALLALTRQLAVELAPAVTVNAIAPGPTIPATSFDADQIDRLARRNLLGKWGDPAEIARTAVFLAEASNITGDCITVDGGERWGHVRARFAD